LVLPAEAVADSKVGQFNVVVLIDENILRFDVPVKYFDNFMAIPNCADQLSEVPLQVSLDQASFPHQRVQIPLGD